MVQHNIIFAYGMTMAEEKYTSEGIFTKYTPYLVLPGELCGVLCEDLGEYWLHYNDITLYVVHMEHYNDVIMGEIKENINAPRHCPFCGEFTSDRWIPRTKGQ